MLLGTVGYVLQLCCMSDATVSVVLGLLPNVLLDMYVCMDVCMCVWKFVCMF